MREKNDFCCVNLLLPTKQADITLLVTVCLSVWRWSNYNLSLSATQIYLILHTFPEFFI